jgi:PD-(D/E)XK nuclease superfamily
MTQIRLSWSAMQSFLTCPRKHHLTYLQNLQKKPTAEKARLVFGSAFHKGIETALHMSVRGRHSLETYQTEAVAAARKYVTDNTVSGLTVRNHKGELVTDTEYYNSMADVKASVGDLLRYHIKVMGFGSHFHDRFIVPALSDLAMGEAPSAVMDANALPLIEYHFEYELLSNVVLSGYVDAILWDVELGQYVIYDWKTRTQFPFDQYAEIDGQLHLYAAVINELFPLANVSEVRMYQMLTKPPQPASISKKGVPNLGAASYNTTWEVWCATLPRGLVAEHYREALEGKLKTDEDFYRVVSVPITRYSCHEALDNAVTIAHMIEPAYEWDAPPAVLSSNGCKFCEFAMLCGGVLRYGGDATSVLTEHYIPRKIESIEEDITEE